MRKELNADQWVFWGEWAWPGGAGPAPAVLMAVSLCRAEDEDLLSVSFVFLSLSDHDVNFHISIRVVFWLVVLLKFKLSDLVGMLCLRYEQTNLCSHVVFVKCHSVNLRCVYIDVNHFIII